jgi:hypothetical protein
LRRAAVAPAIVSALLAGPAAHAQPNRARAELEQGYELRNRHAYAEALPHLLESYRLAPQLKTLINLADCEEQVGKLVDAKAHWSSALTLATEAGDGAIAQEASRRVAALAARIPKLKIVASTRSSASRIDEDGSELPSASIGVPVPTDPGHHRIIVHADGFEDQRYEINLYTGETRELVVTTGRSMETVRTPPAEASSSRPLRPVGLAVAGAGLLVMGVGAYFGIVAIQKKHEANCPNNVCTAPSGNPDALRDAVGAGRLATICVASGAGVLAGGIALWLLAPRSSGGHDAGVVVVPSLGTQSAALTVSDSW